MPPFVPGLILSEVLYRDSLSRALAGIDHAAARIGWGSDVLGFDTPTSTDHGWGPQLLVVTEPASIDEATARMEAALPDDVLGWPTRFGWDDRPSGHWVRVATIEDWAGAQLAVDPHDELSTIDWLVLPQQALLETTRGVVFHDALGDLTRLRERLRYYPDGVWLWLLACQWRRVAQEEAFVGRAAEVGDDLGSTLVAARLARELMRLWFLFERTYWPYTKWFGSSFDRLPVPRALVDALSNACTAASYDERERALVAAYELTGARHDELGITEVVAARATAFHNRGFQVIQAERFVDACCDRLEPALAALPLVGAVDQLCDSTDLLSAADRAGALRSFYEALAT